jgi:hypothetical protein
MKRGSDPPAVLAGLMGISRRDLLRMHRMVINVLRQRPNESLALSLNKCEATLGLLESDRVSALRERNQELAGHFRARSADYPDRVDENDGDETEDKSMFTRGLVMSMAESTTSHSDEFLLRQAEFFCWIVRGIIDERDPKRDAEK